jgi:hypothetical protein
MDFLLEELEIGRNDVQYQGDKFMKPCINAGWSKLDKYYKLTDCSTAFIAAVVCCPQNKWEYFSEAVHWPRDWIKTGQRKGKELLAV